MSGKLTFDNTEIFVTPGTATPFLELTSAPGVTGFRLYTQGSQLLVRDTLNNTTVFATQGVTGATGPRGAQGNPGIGIQGPTGATGTTDVSGWAVFPATQNPNIGGYKITNLAAGTTSTDAVNYSQLLQVQQIGATNAFWVAKNGVDISGGGQVYAPFLTIQFAINQCTPGAQDNGQTIFIFPGLYVEDLTIADKNLNIRGSGDAQHTFNTTIRGNITITSSNSSRSYRTVSFQFIEIQNYIATTGKAITLNTTGSGQGRFILTGCYVVGASSGVSLLDATAANCNWIIICDTTRFYTSFAYSNPLINLGGALGTAPILTLNQCLVEYESPAGSTNSLIKTAGYSGLTSQYTTITQPLNTSLTNSALTNGLVWIANLPNGAGDSVPLSTNGASIGTTLMFSGTQATLGVNGTSAMFIERGCPSVYLIGGTLSVRSNSTPATFAVVGSGTGVTKTIIYFNNNNMMTTRGTANKVDNTNLIVTSLIAVT